MTCIISISSFIAAKVAVSCDRLVVRTLRCGRRNPGSNPGHSTFDFLDGTDDINYETLHN